MAVGIGGTSAIFAGFEGMLLRPLPLPASEKLATLYERTPDGEWNLLSPPDHRDFVAQAPSLKSGAAYYTRISNLSTPHGPQKVELGAVTASFLPTLGLQPALGRNFAAEDEPRGKNHLLLLTDGAWRRRFGGATDLLGKSVTVDGQPFTVIGILPRGFSFPGLPDVEGLVPLGLTAVELGSRGNHFLWAVARLKDDATVQQASRDLSQVAKAADGAGDGGAAGSAAGRAGDGHRAVRRFGRHPPLAVPALRRERFRPAHVCRRGRADRAGGGHRQPAPGAACGDHRPAGGAQVGVSAAPPDRRAAFNR